MSLFPFELFVQLLRDAPLHPAGSFWRALEMESLILRALPRLREAREILDLGCGDGRFMATMRSHLPLHAVLTGAEPDAQDAARARETGLFSSVVEASAEELPFKDGSFDAVIASSVLEHIGPVRKAIEEASRVLRPGGLFIVTAPGPDFHACLCGPRAKVCKAYFEKLDNRLIHLRYWTAAAWQERFLPARLSLVECYAYLNDGEARRWHLLSRLTSGLVFDLTGWRKGLPFARRVRCSDGSQAPVPFWVRALGRILLAGFKEPAVPALHAGLLLIAWREPDPYPRKESSLS